MLILMEVLLRLWLLCYRSGDLSSSAIQSLM